MAGLQQLWTEDGLALHVLAVARHSYTAKVNNKKKKTYHVGFRMSDDLNSAAVLLFVL